MSQPFCFDDDEDLVALEYGKAMLSVQVLELAIAKLCHVSSKKPGAAMSPRAFEKTMRRMLHDYRKASVEEKLRALREGGRVDELMPELEDFKTRRNFLAHRFLLDTVEQNGPRQGLFAQGTIERLQRSQEKDVALRSRISKWCAATATAEWGPQPGLDDVSEAIRTVVAELLVGDATRLASDPLRADEQATQQDP